MNTLEIGTKEKVSAKKQDIKNQMESLELKNTATKIKKTKNG